MNEQPQPQSAPEYSGPMTAPALDKDPKEEAINCLIQDRQDRIQRAGQAIAEACQKERVILHVPGFKIVNGAIEGQIQIVPLD